LVISIFFCIFAEIVYNVMIKKIKSYKDIQNGDIIMLYGASDKGKIVQKRYLKIESTANNGPRDVIIWNRCYVVREDGSHIKDRWSWSNKLCQLFYNKNLGKFSCTDGTYNTYYIDPKIPCEIVIKRLKEEKMKINKKIVDCQNYMYKISD